MKVCQQKRAAYYRLRMKCNFLIVEDWSGPDQIAPLANTEVTKSKHSGHHSGHYVIVFFIIQNKWLFSPERSLMTQKKSLWIYDFEHDSMFSY